MRQAGHCCCLLLIALLLQWIGPAFLLWASPSGPVENPGSSEPQSIDDLHFNSIVVITHVDTPWHMVDSNFDITVRNPTGHVDLPRMREGGVDAAFFVVWVDPDDFSEQTAYQHALDIFLAVHRVDWLCDEMTIVDRVDEMSQIVRTGDASIWLGVEGAHALGTGEEELALRRLHEFRALGARYMTITWSRDNPLGHSSTGRHPERGLTRLGTRVVREMERIGMVVDVSHASAQTFEDIMEITTLPVLATHSGVRALADHPRNMTDEMIRRVADHHGAVCVNFYPDYLDPQYARQRRRLTRDHRSAFSQVNEQELGYTEQGMARREIAVGLDPDLPIPDIHDVADHIMHIVELTGPDTACIGTDFDGIPETPLGLEDVSTMPALTQELRNRGLPDHHIVKILGGNVLRVLEAWE